MFTRSLYCIYMTNLSGTIVLDGVLLYCGQVVEWAKFRGYNAVFRFLEESGW